MQKLIITIIIMIIILLIIIMIIIKCLTVRDSALTVTKPEVWYL